MEVTELLTADQIALVTEIYGSVSQWLATLATDIYDNTCIIVEDIIQI